jgi:hypothetical protein
MTDQRIDLPQDVFGWRLGFKDRFQALSLAESRLKVIGIMSTH